MEATQGIIGKPGAHTAATGGAGTTLEHHVGAVLLAHLLVGAPLPSLGIAAAPTHVGFQSPKYPVDDFVVESARENGDAVHIAIAVRRSPNLVPSDPASLKLMRTFFKTALESWEDIRQGTLRLCLVVRNPSIHAQQLRQLAQIASTQSNPEDFLQRLPSGTNTAQRDRLGSLRGMLEALRPKLNSPLGTNEILWRTLHGLCVHEARLEPGQSADRDAAQLLLHDADQISWAEAEGSYHQLLTQSADYAALGARVDRTLLCARLNLPARRFRAAADGPLVDVQAAIEGPLRHLGLEQTFSEAAACLDEDARRAADLYGTVAQTLQADPLYAAFAWESRRRQAQALRQAGDMSASAAVELDLMAAALIQGDADLAERSGRRLLKEAHDEPRIDPAYIRSAEALSAVALHETDHNVSLAVVAQAVDELREDDPYRAQALLLFSEFALVGDAPEFVRERAQVLKAVAVALPEGVDRVRMLACLADAEADLDWPTTLRSVRSTEPLGLALSHARHGRHLARIGRGSEALTAYQNAIEHAFKASDVPVHDAADWLEAQRLVRARYRFELDELAESHLMPAALRRSGTGMLLPRATSAREKALARLAKGNAAPYDVLQALTRYRLESVVTGAWQRETEADRLLGEFHLRHGEPGRGWPNLVAAHATSVLEGYTHATRNRAFDLPTPAGGVPAWQLADLYTLAGAVADVVPDEQAAGWVAELLPRLGPATDRAVRVAALMAAAAFTPAASEDEARRMLTAIPDPIANPMHARLLKAIARHHRALRPAAVEQLCLGLNADLALFAREALNGTQETFKAESALVAQMCRQAAENGVVSAAHAMGNAGVVNGMASVARALAEPITKPTSTAGGPRRPTDLVVAALFASALSDTERRALACSLRARVLDKRQLAMQRQEALDALGLLAPALTRDERAELLSDVRGVARGELDGSIGDDDDPMHPYDRSGVDWGTVTLAYAGLQAWATLAPPEDHPDVRVEAARLFLKAPQPEAVYLSRVLDRLGADPVVFPIGQLAAHASPSVRALAARWWCETPKEAPALGAHFAEDPDPYVRGTVAYGLHRTVRDSPLLVSLRKDAHRSVRQGADGRPAAPSSTA
ncbi:hypothetical protein ACIBSV_49710 [Embleya sp. NPDC050154]|uniref:hypothetical protein n=1 Tax=Embleya sp. NPDC050154 TaxID=3363988 RepID=UPI0037AAF748